MPVFTYLHDTHTRMLKIEFIKKDKDLGIIEGLRGGQKGTLNDIYERFYPFVKDHVLKNSGSEDDAKDVFQDAMMAIFQNVSDSDFELTCQFKTYLYAVSTKIWRKKLRGQKTNSEDINIDIEQIAQEEIDDAVLKMERYKFYQRKFDQLSEKCQQLLKMFLNGVDMKRITEHYNFASVAYTKKRKFQCKENLIKLIEQDPEYEILIGHE